MATGCNDTDTMMPLIMENRNIVEGLVSLLADLHPCVFITSTKGNPVHIVYNDITPEL